MDVLDLVRPHCDRSVTIPIHSVLHLLELLHLLLCEAIFDEAQKTKLADALKNHIDELYIEC